MLKVSHTTLLRVSGCVWFCIGVMLLRLGIQFSLRSLDHPEETLFNLSENGIIVLLAIAIGIGTLKGKIILKKTALRACQRITLLDNPASLFSLYGPASYAIIAVMMSLGICMNYFHTPCDIRGFIDIAVGSALTQGSLHYFRYTASQTLQQETDSSC